VGAVIRRLVRHVGVAVAVFPAHVVLRLLSLHHAWCCGHCHRAVGAARGCHLRQFEPHVVSQSWSVRHVWCHGCRLCAACSAAGAIIAPRMVLWVLLSGCVSVAVVVFVPHVVSGVPPLRCMWCCGHCRCAVHGVCSCEGHGDVVQRCGVRLGGAR
jgi:hypothetical protein